MLTLLSLVGDLAVRAYKFVDNLRKADARWPGGAISEKYGLKPQQIDDMCMIAFAGFRTRAIIGYIWYPAIIMLIHAILTVRVVSTQAMPLPVIVATATCLVAVVLVLALLHFTVEPLRGDVIRRFSDSLLIEKSASGSVHTAAQLEYLVQFVKDYDLGAFKSMWRQPFLGALALPSAVWTPSIIQYLTSG
jgi:hypothetical protein